MNITVIGTGYVGLVTGACLADVVARLQYYSGAGLDPDTDLDSARPLLFLSYPSVTPYLKCGRSTLNKMSCKMTPMQFVQWERIVSVMQPCVAPGG